MLGFPDPKSLAANAVRVGGVVGVAADDGVAGGGREVSGRSGGGIPA